jgi:hypothetical protein
MLGPLIDEHDVVPGFDQNRADGRAVRPAAQNCDFFGINERLSIRGLLPPG